MRDHVAFHSVNVPVKSYTCDKESFIGMYGSEEHPRAMKSKILETKCDRFGDACASLQVEIELAPGESKDIVFTIGAAKIGEEDPFELSKKYTDVNAARDELENVKIF
ncbi:MAG: hypothetical protein ABDH59_07865 [Fervidobacterium sp.]